MKYFSIKDDPQFYKNTEVFTKADEIKVTIINITS